MRIGVRVARGLWVSFYPRLWAARQVRPRLRHRHPLVQVVFWFLYASLILHLLPFIVLYLLGRAVWRHYHV
jgi:hypothetical protein